MKTRHVSAFQRPLARKLDPIAAIVDKGIVVDSEHVIAERLPDGRISLKLSPNLRAGTGGGAPPGGPYGGNIFVIS